MAATSNVPVRPLKEILAEAVFREASMEVHFTATTSVSCAGPGGALGHPKVFYTITDKGYAECGYCDRLFVYDPVRAGTVLEGGFIEAGHGFDAITGPAKSPA